MLAVFESINAGDTNDLTTDDDRIAIGDPGGAGNLDGDGGACREHEARCDDA